jgi:hypothetical protein
MSGLGVPLSLLARFIEKVVLDTTGLVQLRHAFHAGGLYYCFNAVMTHVACFVAAVLYSVSSTVVALDHKSDNATGGHHTGANATNITAANNNETLPANDTAAENGGKIDDFTLFATIMTLSAVSTIAFVSLLLTMKRQYVRTFVSMQTGCAFSRSHFLDHDGDDARRAHIFYCNRWHWRSIRDVVRQWVLSAYATWLQLNPAWLTHALRTMIPGDFMPAPLVQQLDAQAPGGRRRTLENIGALRRVSLAFAGPDDTAGSSAMSASGTGSQGAAAASDSQA